MRSYFLSSHLTLASGDDYDCYWVIMTLLEALVLVSEVRLKLCLIPSEVFDRLIIGSVAPLAAIELVEGLLD